MPVKSFGSRFRNKEKKRIPQGHELSRKDSGTPQKDPFMVSPHLGEGVAEDEKQDDRGGRRGREKPESEAPKTEEGRPQHYNAEQELHDQDEALSKYDEEPKEPGQPEHYNSSQELADQDEALSKYDDHLSPKEQMDAADSLKAEKVGDKAVSGAGKGAEELGEKAVGTAGRTAGQAAGKAGTEIAGKVAAQAGGKAVGAGAAAAAGTAAAPGVGTAIGLAASELISAAGEGLKKFKKGDLIGGTTGALNSIFVPMLIIISFADIVGLLGLPAYFFLLLYKLTSLFAPSVCEPLKGIKKYAFYLLTAKWISYFIVAIAIIVAILGMIGAIPGVGLLLKIAGFFF